MSKPSLSRIDYFVSSLTGFAVLAAVFFVALASTLGYQGLLASLPGKARGSLVLVTVVSSVICALFQSNLGRRRAAETRLPRWFVAAYVSLLYLCALAYSAQLFYYDFSNVENNEGSLRVFFFGLCACWGCLAFAAPSNVDHGNIRPDMRKGVQGRVETPRVLNPRRSN